jgi:UDPglucose--hexose-1-phosphate uridylyltransferase
MDVRVDPLTGATTVVTGARQARPNLPSTGCPFCVGGLEAPEPYDVRWFTNRWPAISEGRAEVLLYTPDHSGSWATLGAAGARRVVDLWASRTAALGARDDVAYVLPFENRGPEVGATIAHPHGQLYAFPPVRPAARAELDRATCALCSTAAPADELLVARAGDWWAAVPAAATWPYELLLAPQDHVPDLVTADEPAKDGLAALLVDVLGRLDRRFDAPMPFMLWVHQRPTDGGDWPAAHLHVHVAPLLRSAGVPRFVAASELGSGVVFHPVVPEVAAEELRAT